MTRPATYHAPRWIAAAGLAVALAATFGAVLLVRTQGAGLAALGLAAVSAAAFVGTLDVLMTRVSLEQGALTIRTLFRNQRLPREAIASVTWESGAGVSVRMTSRSWVRLPETGNSQSRANAIRAWLARTASDDAS